MKITLGEKEEEERDFEVYYMDYNAEGDVIEALILVLRDGKKLTLFADDSFFLGDEALHAITQRKRVRIKEIVVEPF